MVGLATLDKKRGITANAKFTKFLDVFFIKGIYLEPLEESKEAKKK